MQPATTTIPPQQRGSQTDTVHRIYVPDIIQAHIHFLNSCQKLLKVNDWKQVSGNKGASFQLIDELGKSLQGHAREGDFIRIGMPLPSPSENGEGYDWVRIEKIEKDQLDGLEWMAIRVRPAIPPFNQQSTQKDRQTIAHFFAPGATSSFIVERRHHHLIASVNGRNETPNLKTPGLFTRIRNFMIAIAAMLGLNKSQWKALAKGLLEH
ncbi:MAG: hypothetical protein P0Y53_15800 [Candidatus Pseudobacter hemicellulosilyticus]|uniref:Uncharacterized protein n=1 Tax=Candidatus Pseudobacter hemicellulosilyticus TaxID=3121375 RepID=A0AAJ6BF69_9BACT|nr:MAG: hypothetical protein P0Y53_15800 [Pseudobacter sp.]